MQTGFAAELITSGTLDGYTVLDHIWHIPS